MSALGAVHDRIVAPRRANVIARHLAAHLPQGADVLDVGCGDGLIARTIMDLRPDVGIHGIDVKVRPDTHIRVDVFDGRTLPFGDRTVDVTLLVDVLHHTTDALSLLREAARVTRQMVLIKDHTRHGVASELTLRLMDWVGNARFDVPLPYSYWTTEEWNEAFLSAELTVEGRDTRLGLYRPPVSWLFDRSLHFMARLRPIGPQAGTD